MNLFTCHLPRNVTIPCIHFIPLQEWMCCYCIFYVSKVEMRRNMLANTTDADGMLAFIVETLYDITSSVEVE